jgi:hypothetical protein
MIQLLIVVVHSNRKAALLKLSWMGQRRSVEVAQNQPISIETIAVVNPDAAGKDAIRKHRPKAVSMKSQIANG